jgi:hypothetical protein
MTPSDPIIPQKVSKWQLRATWNDPAFQSAMLRRCTQRVMVREELAPSGSGQEEGAMSQVYDLYDNPAGEFLGTFHRYQNLDGSIGASGKEDPIWLLIDGVLHYDP